MSTRGRIGSSALFGTLLVAMLPLGEAQAQTPVIDFESPQLVSGLVDGGDGYLYGTTYSGGSAGHGSIFRVVPSTGVWTTMASFDWFNGSAPRGKLVQQGWYLYGVATTGGDNGNASIFRYTLGSDLIERMATFPPDGPETGLVAYGGYLYGTTTSGGTSDRGSVFRFDPATGELVTIASFTSSHGYLANNVLTVCGSYLYGTTYAGGVYDHGTIFRVDPATGALTTLHSFNDPEGQWPNGGLVLHNSLLYGATGTWDGTQYVGIVYTLNPANNQFATVGTFSPGGPSPRGELVAFGDDLYGTTLRGGLTGEGSIYRVNVGAGTVSADLASFGGIYGRFPVSGLTAYGTYLYGTAAFGGNSGGGTVFQFNPATLAFQPRSHFFSDGAAPEAPLIQYGNFLYGTTAGGGAYGCGVFYQLNPATLQHTALSSFDCAKGKYPKGGLILYDSYFYGTASKGGSWDRGTVYKIAPATGAITRLAEFNSTNGEGPNGDLISYDGYLWGTTELGGTSSQGTIFKIDPATGTLTTVASMTGWPKGGLTLQAVPGSTTLMYGTTYRGGAPGKGTVFRFNPATSAVSTIMTLGGAGATPMPAYPTGTLLLSGSYLYGTSEGNSSFSTYGTVYRVNPANGDFLVVASLGSEGSPHAGVITDGTFLYGTSYLRGDSGHGTVFKVDPGNGTLTTLASFSGINGRRPVAPLTLLAGMLWGTASAGGTRGGGVAFKLAFDRTATTTSLMSSLNPSTYGNSVMFTATVSAGATGTITFRDGEINIAMKTISAGHASINTHALSPGAHTITAVYGGDSSHAGSKSSSLTQTVNTLPSIAFTDDPLVAGTTPVKAAHILELRSGVNALRSQAGLPNAGWATTVQNGAAITAAQFSEVRNALAGTLTTLGRSTTFSTLIAPGLTIRAADVQEMRNRLK